MQIIGGRRGPRWWVGRREHRSREMNKMRAGVMGKSKTKRRGIAAETREHAKVLRPIQRKIKVSRQRTG